MNEKIIELEVKPDSPDETVEAAGGTMFEHNATALSFCLSPEYCLPEYKYYLEFVTVHGVLRTEYLIPNEAHKIIFSIPQEVTSQMTALAVLNIVAFDAAGKTKQLIKSQKVRLYFCNLENTDKTLCENYAFSVNQLLEAIQNGTFKGEKGDKGENYVLTAADKQEITDKTSYAAFGLPFWTQNQQHKKMNVSDITEEVQFRALSVMPQKAGETVEDVKLTFGQNILEPILDSKKYSTFQDVQNNYAFLHFTLEPNTRYVLSRTYGKLFGNCTSMIKSGEYSECFCHSKEANINIEKLSFVTPKTGEVLLKSTAIYSSERSYQKVLENEWAGLTLTKEDSSCELRKHFEVPLCAVDETYKDSYDFVSGLCTRKTASVSLQQSMLQEAETALSDGVHTVYLYTFALPLDAPEKAAGLCNGLSESYKVIEQPLPDGAELTAYIAAGGQTEGVFVGTSDQTIWLYSEKAKPEFLEELAQREHANTPVRILYCRQSEEKTKETPLLMPFNFVPEELHISPLNVECKAIYTANLSRKAVQLEARIAALENRMNGENL